MADPFEKVGLYVDDQNEIRLLEPVVYEKSLKLKDLSENFMASKLLIQKV